MICPLQLGLGVQMHRQFGSRYLVESLYNLGFSSSYSEVQKYEASAAVQKSKEMVNVGEDAFLQFAADNVDHNTHTIDGEKYLQWNGDALMSYSSSYRTLWTTD